VPFLLLFILPPLPRVDITQSELRRARFLRISDVSCFERLVSVAWCLDVTYVYNLTTYINISHFKTVPYYAN